MNIAVNFSMFFHGSKHRLIAQRAATEQATDVLLLRGQTGANLFNQRPVERMQIQTLFFTPVSSTAFNAASLVPRANCRPFHPQARLHGPETHHHGLMTGACTFQHLVRHRWRRRFGDKCDDLSLRIGLQHANRVKHHQAANLFTQIASTCAN